MKSEFCPKLSVVLAIAAVVSLGPGSALSQWNPMPGVPPPTAEDVARMQAAVARLNEGRSIGNTERWRSLGSGNAGEVKLARTFVAQGRQCRTLVYAVRFHGQPRPPLQFTRNWCLYGDAWKIVELPPEAK